MIALSVKPSFIEFGHMAERLGKGLQNLLRRFKSACDLINNL